MSAQVLASLIPNVSVTQAVGSAMGATDRAFDDLVRGMYSLVYVCEIMTQIDT